jgi:hypothetical protein
MRSSRLKYTLSRPPVSLTDEQVYFQITALDVANNNTGPRSGAYARRPPLQSPAERCRDLFLSCPLYSILARLCGACALCRLRSHTVRICSQLCRQGRARKHTIDSRTCQNAYPLTRVEIAELHCWQTVSVAKMRSFCKGSTPHPHG